MFIGVDLAWSANNKSGVAVYDGESIVHTAWLKNLSEIITVIEKYQPCVIAIDAPLNIPNKTGNRYAEKELNKIFQSSHAGAYPANRTLLGKYNNGIPRGEELRFLVSHYECIEVYPHAASIRYFGLARIIKYKRDPTQLPVYEELLATKVSFNLITKRNKEREDILDAIMCALVAKSYIEGNTQTFGDEIVVPLS